MAVAEHGINLSGALPSAKLLLKSGSTAAFCSSRRERQAVFERIQGSATATFFPLEIKNLLFLCLCLLGRAAFAQVESAKAFEGANGLVLTTTDSDSVALADITESLAVYGVRTTAVYGVRPSAEPGKPLRTQTLPRAIHEISKRAYVTYVVTISPGPNCQINLTGQVAATGSMNEDMASVAITGGETGRSLAAFRVMEGAAGSYMSGARIRKKPVQLRYVKQ